VRDWHDYYDRHEDHRPPRTWQEQQQVARRDGPRAALETQLFARNLVEVAKRNDEPVRLSRLDQQTRQALIEKTARLRELHASRRLVEREEAPVAAQLPSARSVREPDPDSHEPRDKRGANRDRTHGDDGEKAAVAIQRPKWTLPKESTKVVPSGAGSPRSKLRPETSGESRGPANGAAGTASTFRNNAGRRDPIPPPMATTIERDGRAHPQTPRSTLPAESDGTNPAARLPKIDRPSRDAAKSGDLVPAPTEQTPAGKARVENPRPQGPSRDLQIGEASRAPRGEKSLPGRAERTEIRSDNRAAAQPQSEPPPRPDNRPEVRTRPDLQSHLENLSKNINSNPRIELPKSTPRVEPQRGSSSDSTASQAVRSLPRDSTAPRLNVVPRENSISRERPDPREHVRPAAAQRPSEVKASTASQPRSESRPSRSNEVRSGDSRSSRESSAAGRDRGRD
jgi:hypothetical protein